MCKRILRSKKREQKNQNIKTCKHKLDLQRRRCNQKSLLCDICEVVLYQKTKLTHHMRILHMRRKPPPPPPPPPTLPFECSLCCNGFENKSDLNKHLQEHDANMAFDCLLCDEKCTTPEELDQHMESTNHLNVGSLLSILNDDF